MLFAIASVITPVFGAVVTDEGSFVVVPTFLVGLFSFFGLWLFVDGAFRSTPPEEELDFSDIPYADGSPTKKPEPVKAEHQTIEEKLAARRERLEKAKREGKI